MEKADEVKQEDVVNILITTAQADNDSVLQAMETAHIGYLLKPIRKEMLLRELKKLNLIES